MDWQALLRQANELEVQISQLRKQKEEILRQDLEYAAYLDAYEERGGNQPLLGLAGFHRFQDELDGINRRFAQLDPQDQGDRYERLWRECRRRIVDLERLLLA